MMARVLLVEDSPTQAQQLALLLEEADFDVVVAADAEQGTERLMRESFDALLTDLVLPGASGFDLCRTLKADPRLRHMPVVVLTSQADPLNVLRGLEAGADGFMTKNREPAEIIGRLRRTLDRKPPAGDDGAATRVVFLDAEFELAVDNRQLLNVLLAAFEDVVHLNQQFERKEAELRKVNGQLHDSLKSEHATLEQLKTAQSQLVQAEKLSALGQLVAGMAHEINNPLALVSSNITVLQRDTQALRQVIELYQQTDRWLGAQDPELLTRIQELADRTDLTYTLGNLQGLLTRSRDGLARIEKIVKGLRDFARTEERERQRADLNAGIESTINLLRAQAEKRDVAIILDLAPLPPVTCFPTKINQVVLNLVTNALDACSAKGQVTVRTRVAPEGVEIHVLDNGCGVDPAIQDKIFDPFFTTKPLGQGTGLGLSISYGIVRDHGGRLSFTSVLGQGTQFIFCLPLRPAPAEPQAWGAT